ncbi:DUF6891 domain-containing protein [Streptomyces sp. NPDC056227]|uniref:DUF6891 domain-containing protein n=1 Tax=Streptomyces sp. NPDC056227 TaxID=3345753 RepID=UPI0035DF32FD
MRGSSGRAQACPPTSRCPRYPRRSEATTVAIGREVAAALGAAGLTVKWDGSPGQAIEVTDLDRRRRLVG